MLGEYGGLGMKVRLGCICCVDVVALSTRVGIQVHGMLRSCCLAATGVLQHASSSGVALQVKKHLYNPSNAFSYIVYDTR